MRRDIVADAHAKLYMDLFMQVHVVDCDMVLNRAGYTERFCLCGAWTTIMQQVDTADEELLCPVCVQYGASYYIHGAENA